MTTLCQIKEHLKEFQLNYEFSSWQLAQNFDQIIQEVRTQSTDHDHNVHSFVNRYMLYALFLVWSNTNVA